MTPISFGSLPFSTHLGKKYPNKYRGKTGVFSCFRRVPLCNPMDYSLPSSAVHGILQARILECVAIPFSRGSSWPRDQTWVFCTAGRFFIAEPPGMPYRGKISPRNNGHIRNHSYQPLHIKKPWKRKYTGHLIDRNVFVYLRVKFHWWSCISSGHSARSILFYN